MTTEPIPARCEFCWHPPELRRAVSGDDVWCTYWLEPRAPTMTCWGFRAVGSEQYAALLAARATSPHEGEDEE